jgi:anthranilate/para-aminobenzoate synthase component II
MSTDVRLQMIDNYDSFTYNLVQYLGELGADVIVDRNDEISMDEIHTFQPEKIVISPGPCTPNKAGISMDVIRIKRHLSNSWGVSGASMYWPGIRREHYSCKAYYAW